ncbi:LEAF RUST 10 DISEASE-RESISTANCE LOCUS RECEPTOR-LIKE PROTEIN KINASE-like 1.1 isoform X2 [Beta vulgaris subsp. vulgaris]|uniref:LEAF RUST 10 DISEASE-RESISTANCE LOCUS RECEPTOR-LIKE PROTEIN KINASE-like 1.1 isoform X2 n=1 Tax=Beta vulgaris subsp. vulgaris TaxID=3555 RepID=UPI0020374409|nr:LEAF RUST 10 DISEASE-RESISTANCE LOCUS RECEPTOR-LIKE PROTEIN KINASE-like 1.1 isoform X2 [Beta vulgaris subsp. vulgaris]
MVSYVFLLHFPFCITFIIVMFFAVSMSNGEDTNYAACSIPYLCGNIKVGYPFWSDNRPKFCGVPHLKLKCKNDNGIHTTINVFENGYANLGVLAINMPSNTIVVSPHELFDKCHPKDSNIRLSSTFMPDASYTNISLYYGCSNDCGSKSLNCTNSDGTIGSAYYFDKPSDMNHNCNCSNNVTFPMYKRGLDELRSTKNGSILSILTNNWAIKLIYKANITACSECLKSGGRCGSSEDLTSDQFVCYCSNGSKQLVCHSSGAGVIIVLVAIIAIWKCKKPKHGHSNFVTRSISLDSNASDIEKGGIYFGVPLFSYGELVAATDSFDQSKELGNGGFGTVYYGKLKDGREVAVKRLYEKNYRRMAQFMNEIQLLTRLKHQNLVSLYGCTSQHSRELLLVYEYVKNGTVADHLYGKNTQSAVVLPWNVRLRIAIETATALSYLHASDIIHRDIKTNNILLDGNFCVKVADFGLSRLFPNDVTHVSTAPQGTPGYVDPEYHQCYQLTEKSDVYSFGVVLIELISSLPAIDMDRHKHEINLSNYAINRIGRCAFDELVDPQLGFMLDFKVRRMTTLVGELAFRCLQHDKEFRPSMDEILEILKRIEGADYEALEAEEMVNNGGREKVVGMHSSIPPPQPSHIEDDHAQLLNNKQLHPPSPISVIDKWNSRSTTSSNSK